MKRFNDLSSFAIDLTNNLNQKTKVARLAIANELLKNSQDLVPRDTGALALSGRVYNSGEDYYVVYSTPYVRKVYYVTAITGRLKWIEVAWNDNISNYELIVKKIIEQ